MKQTRNNRNLRKRNMRKNNTIRRRKNKMNGGGWLKSWKDVVGKSHSKGYLIGKFILVYTAWEAPPYQQEGNNIKKSGNYQIYKVFGVSSEKGSNGSNVEYTQHNCIKYDLDFNRINNRNLIADTEYKYDFDCKKTKCGKDDTVMVVKPVLLFHESGMSMHGEQFVILETQSGGGVGTRRLAIQKDQHTKLGEINNYTFKEWAEEEKKKQAVPTVLSNDVGSLLGNSPKPKNPSRSSFFARTLKKNSNANTQKKINSEPEIRSWLQSGSKYKNKTQRTPMKRESLLGTIAPSMAREVHESNKKIKGMTGLTAQLAAASSNFATATKKL